MLDPKVPLEAAVQWTHVAGQAQQVHHVTWLDPIDDREMVQQSVGIS